MRNVGLRQLSLHFHAFFFLLASLASIFFSLAFLFILSFLWDNIVLSGLYRILFLFFSFVGGLRGAEPSSLLRGHFFSSLVPYYRDAYTF